MTEPIAKLSALEHPESWSQGCAFIEGEFVPIADAKIPMLDFGFTRSDCTYDVVSVWNGHFFRLDDHLARFTRSCARGRFTPPLSTEQMRSCLSECVRRTGLDSAYVEMLVTRGVPENGERDPRKVRNRFYAFAIPYVWIASPEVQETGLSMVIARDTTRIEPGSVDPTMKNFHWGDLVRGLLEAYDRDAANVVLLNSAGQVTEGPGFNLFAWTDGALWTPAHGVLEGITRATVLELAAEQRLPVRVTDFGPDRLRQAEELFITSTAGGVMPVTQLDGLPVANGLPGPVTLGLRRAYWDAHTDPRWSTPAATHTMKGSRE